MKEQIAKYRSAVGKRNVGSQPSRAQMHKAKNTAIGKMQGTIRSKNNKNSSAGSTGRLSATKATLGKPRGSWEGYMHAPSAHIVHNNTGYNRSSFQKARNFPRRSIIGKSPTSLTPSKFSPSVSFNHRNIGFADRNSACRLKEITKASKLS